MQKLSAEERKRAKLTALKDLFQISKDEQWEGVYDGTYEEQDTLLEPHALG